MRILLYSNLYSPEPSGVGVYSGGLAESLAARGHEVTVIAANPSYPHWQLFNGFSAWRWSKRLENGVTVLRCPVYIPSRVSGLGRIIHYLSFTATALVHSVSRLFRRRPDLVFHAVPTLMAAPVVLATAKLAGAKTWVHVQDFEVEAGFATGQMNGTGVVAKAALAFERWALRRYDVASSISSEMCLKLVEKGCAADTVYELRNWAEIDTVRPQPHSAYRERWSIDTPHVALYSGAIARKQGMEMILDAARLLSARKDLTFVICGNGPDRKALEQQAADLPNLQFHDLQPKESLCELLNLATVHLLPQRADAADLVLPSKLTNMLASGKPVIATARAGTGLAREVEGCGILTPPEDPEAFAAGIVRLIDESGPYAIMASAARRRAEEVWHRDRIIDRFEIEARRVVATAKRGNQ